MSVQSEFYASQIAVVQSHIHLIGKIMQDISIRLDEVDAQLQMNAAAQEDKDLSGEYDAGVEDGYLDGLAAARLEMEAFWTDGYDPRPADECECFECSCKRDAADYRMD